MKVYDFPQYSAAWWSIRSGKMTASHAQAIASNGKGLDTYVKQIMAEYYSKADPDTYNSAAMNKGLELEPDAATRYMAETFSTVKEVGFVVHNDFVGCSPDRMVDDDGLLEIKCPSDKVYFELLLNEKIDTKYEWQMHMQMLITGRKWCDYVVYNPNFDKDIFIKRVLPDPSKTEKLLAGFLAGEAMIKSIKEKMEA